jgi:hypothetical protein
MVFDSIFWKRNGHDGFRHRRRVRHTSDDAARAAIEGLSGALGI